jgi:hypothetical protein
MVLQRRHPSDFVEPCQPSKRRRPRPGISKGQRAMAHALLYPEAEKGGRGKKTKGVGNRRV